jgi:hypothetical protein
MLATTAASIHDDTTKQVQHRKKAITIGVIKIINNNQ